MWVQFMDMYSGGGTREEWEMIYIEAPTEEDAVNIFEGRFGHSPFDINCSCCGPNYSISSGDTLEEVTEWERSWRDGRVVPLEVYLGGPDVLVIQEQSPTTPPPPSVSR